MKRLAILLVAVPALARAEPAGVAPTAPAPAPAAAPAAAASDVDLATLGLDPSASAFDDKLNIFGFADVSYQAWHFTHHVVGTTDTSGFAAGNFNLYVSKNLTERWRTLAEVRFLYLPNGGMNADGTTTVTAINDPTNFDRPITWGGILIERAYAEYDVDQHLTIRAGRILTPYGIWNTDHGSPAIIAAYRPYVIGEQFFPEQQTGLEAFGKTFVGEYQIGYHATVSNGRSPVDAVSDPDGKLAFGGRLEFEAPWAGTVKLGASGYMGRYSGVATVGVTAPSYEERSYGADALWDHGGLRVQGELIGNDHHWLNNARATSSKGFIPDGRQWGGYVLAGYRLEHYWNVMPFAMVQYIRPIDDTLYREITGYSAGLNFRPSSNVILKVMADYALARGNGLLGNVNIDVITSQLAWVF